MDEEEPTEPEHGEGHGRDHRRSEGEGRAAATVLEKQQQ
jgi:hypothetical protein